MTCTIESEQIMIRSVPVSIVKVTPFDCCCIEMTGFCGAHCAESGEVNATINRKVPATRSTMEDRSISMSYPLTRFTRFRQRQSELARKINCWIAIEYGPLETQATTRSPPRGTK